MPFTIYNVFLKVEDFKKGRKVEAVLYTLMGLGPSFTASLRGAPHPHPGTQAPRREPVQGRACKDETALICATATCSTPHDMTSEASACI